MAETDPAKIPCTEGGQMHVVPRPLKGTHRIACSDCLKAFVADPSWKQGWRPVDTEDTFERLYQAEKVVREQRALPAMRTYVDGEALLDEIARLQRAVMGEPTKAEG